MEYSATFWLILTLICISIQATYSMLEMASVSFNKVRLQYYVSKNNRRAIWLNSLMENPSRLFGTTLLGVNIALQIGSECSRQFYQSLTLSPDWAPFTQVILVLILAELAPMFAARHYAEHVAMLGVPILYASSKIMKPVIWTIEKISLLADYIIGGGRHTVSPLFLTREELEKVFEERDDLISSSGEGDDFNTTVTNIFNLKNKTAEQVMAPNYSVPMVSHHSSVGHLREIFEESIFPYIPIYHRSRRNIVGIVSARDLLNASDSHSVSEYFRPPWFITQSTKILQILEQFRRNNRSVAIVLDGNGLAKGLLTLDSILDEIFGDTIAHAAASQSQATMQQDRVIEKTFSGELKVRDFNEQFAANIAFVGDETLAMLVAKNLEHLPEKGETIRIDRFELTIEETTLMGAKTISVRTLVQ